MYIKLVLLFCLLFALKVYGFGHNFHFKRCYWNAPCHVRWFSGKTVYDDVRHDIRDVRKLKGCEVASVWMLSRHGSRNPTPEETIHMRKAARLQHDIINSHKKGKGNICAQDIEDLEQWRWDVKLDSSQNYLTDFGYKELMRLGFRVKERFPELWTSKEENAYYFRPTFEQRTIMSAKAFVEGFNPEVPIEAAVEADEVIRPYEKCDLYQDLLNQSTIHDELKRFYSSPDFLKLQKTIERRIGIDYPLKPKEIIALYDLCSYGRSSSETRQSPWCALFGKHDLMTLEYVDDIRQYYKNGYAWPINAKLGEIPLKDLYNTFVAATNGSGRLLTGYFSHDSMMMKMYTAMGLFKDHQNITGDNWMPYRKWRTSVISPFGANLIAILYKCDKTEDEDQYKIQFLINEKVLPICSSRHVCGWEEFKKKFGSFAENKAEICNDLDNEVEEYQTTTVQ